MRLLLNSFATLSILAFTAHGVLAACYEDEYVPETVSCEKTADDGFADFQGKGCQIVPSHIKQVEVSCDVVVDIRSSRSGFAVKSLFDAQHPGEWTNPDKNKIINIHPNVIVGSTSGDAVTLGSAWQGNLTMNIMGEIQGASGSANGGDGGNALNANVSGSNGAKVQVNVASTGAIRGGGGGGGKGGTGGKGGGGITQGYSAPEGPRWEGLNNFKGPIYMWSENGDNTHIFWDGRNTFVGNIWWGPRVQGTEFKIGNDVYIRGDLKNTGSHRRYAISKATYTEVNTNGGNGGAGGNGGRGQGYGASKANGISGGTGGAGGTSAGAGGNGGDGGNGGSWGENGSSGIAGINGRNGNRSNGEAGSSGSSGGRAGRAIVNSGNVGLSLASGAEINGAR